jgi:ABC-type phosphate transport system substrate-binding protein
MGIKLGMSLKRTAECVFAILLIAAVAFVTTGAGSAPARIAISGAGSIFDANFFNVAFTAYAKHHPVTVNYQAIGSGAGITLGQNCQVDFWASDVPMIQSELAADKCGRVSSTSRRTFACSISAGGIAGGGQ